MNSVNEKHESTTAIRAYTYPGKRLLDVVFAVGLAIPAFIVTLICAIVIFIECRSSPFFIQTRVGQFGKPFSLIKLRTMDPRTPDLPSHEVTGNLMLKSGALLRKTKIDELPQIWNILNGSMSFVGPRPCLPSQATLISERAAHGVDKLVPGITGPAQVQGIDMSDPVRLAQKDATYFDLLTLKADLNILFRTFVGQGSGDAIKG